MIKFLLHKKFWLPLVIIFILIVCLELLLRMGYYDNFVKPRSHMGNSFERDRALNDFGVNNIHWITVGDSRIDWGINHKKLKEERKKQNINHLRMSFGGADFLAIQAITEWSINNLGSLEGIVLGVSENKLTQKASFKKLYPISWPFKKAINFENYHMMAPDLKPWRYYYSLALVNYFQDIKNFIQNPIERLKGINSLKNKNTERVFNYHTNKTNNICGFPLDSLKSCVESVKEIKKTNKTPKGFSLPVNLCDSFLARYRLKNNISVGLADDKKGIVNSWQTLITHILSEEKQMVLVLLPDHEMYDYMLKPDDARQITNQIIEKLRNHPQFLLVDLRNLIPSKDQCNYYSDPLHFNNKGIRLITNKLIEVLNDKIDLKGIKN